MIFFLIRKNPNRKKIFGWGEGRGGGGGGGGRSK